MFKMPLINLDLHRPVGDMSDWEREKPENWNAYQKIAAKTYGIITIANIIDGACLALGLLAAKKAYNEQYLTSASLLTIVEAGDAIDGGIAKITGTIWPGGEVTDSAKDLIVQSANFLANPAVPKLTRVVVVAEKAINAAIAIDAKLKGQEFHTSFLGKASTVAQGGLLISCTLSKGLSQINIDPRVPETIDKMSRIFDMATLSLGTAATAGYVKQYISNRGN